MIVDMDLERRRLRSGIYVFKQVTEPLSPRQGSGLCCVNEFVGIDFFSKLREDRCHLIEAADLMVVSDKIDRRSFGR